MKMQEILTIKNRRGQEVGWIDEHNQYRTTRDYFKGQIFRHPKYKSAVAVDIDIIKELIKRKVNTIIIEIINFEETDFLIKTDIIFFLNNSDIINFDKRAENIKISTYYSEQRAMPMNLWERVYINQKRIVQCSLKK